MGIFKDPDKLLPTYVPSSTPHREAHLSTIIRRLEKGYSGRFVLVGPSGSGKTMILKLVERQMRNLFRATYINVNGFKNPYDIISKIYEVVIGEEIRGLSLHRCFEHLIKYIIKNDIDILLLLDDADHLFTKHPDFLRMLSRPEEITASYSGEKLHIIFSVRSRRVFDKLDQATLSSLRAHIIELNPYSYEALIDIISYRCSEAFKEGAYTHDAVETAADIATQYSGNARIALDLMYKAGWIAEETKSKCIEPEHVRYARKDLPPAITLNLNNQEKVLLYSVAELLLHSKTAYIENREVENRFVENLEYFNLNKVSHREYMKMLKKLDALGIISLRQRGKQYIVGLPSMPATVIVNRIDDILST